MEHPLVRSKTMSRTPKLIAAGGLILTAIWLASFVNFEESTKERDRRPTVFGDTFDVQTSQVQERYFNPPSNEDLMKELSGDTSSNIPYDFLFKHWNKDKEKNPKSGPNITRVPSPFGLRINNDIWQVAEFENGSFFALAAYFDNRPAALDQGKPVVRILGMSDIINLPDRVSIQCTIWWDDQGNGNAAEPLVVPVSRHILMYPAGWVPDSSADGFLQPYLLTCPITRNVDNAPVAVSLVEKKGTKVLRNCIRIRDDRLRGGEDRKHLAVCVKEMEFPFPGLAGRLVEWIELLRVLGVDKIFLYDLLVHENVKKVMDYYSERGIVHAYPYKMAQFQPNGPPGLLHLYMQVHAWRYKGRQQVVVHTDCALRNMYRYKYIAVVDTDEVIMPLKQQNYTDLIEFLKEEDSKTPQKTSLSHFSFKNMYFLDDFDKVNDPHYLPPPAGTAERPWFSHIMRHVIRSSRAVPPPRIMKSITVADRVLSMYQHFPMFCVGGPCRGHIPEQDVAYSAHYRKSCAYSTGCKDRTENRAVDTRAWEFEAAISGPVEATLASLGLIGDES